jgi:hypothetical protein
MTTCPENDADPVFRNSCARRQPGHALPSRRGRDRAEASNYPSGATETFVYAAFPPLADPLGGPGRFREFPDRIQGISPYRRVSGYSPSLAEVPWPAENRHRAPGDPCSILQSPSN